MQKVNILIPFQHMDVHGVKHHYQEGEAVISERAALVAFDAGWAESIEEQSNHMELEAEKPSRRRGRADGN